jgi:uncharacterized protein YjiS (DUF1127 family)
MRTVSHLRSVSISFPSITQRERVAWRRLPKAAWLRFIGVLREWRQRSRDRAQLALLDERMLRDIGVSRGAVLTEINKPFWKK